jgi:Zn-dependent peptidase ImmA (M78 family)
MSKGLPPVRRYTFKELSRVAQDFLAAHHPGGELPVPIEGIAEFELGLDIVPVPGLMSDLDVDAFITADLKEIRVDQYIQQRVPARYRASLAHEVGHTLIHGDFFRELRFATIAEWKAVLASMSTSAIDKLEDQARLLGALILVPPSQLKAQFDLAVAKLPGGMRVERLSEKGQELFAGGVAKPFEVSAALMFRRLRQDRLI